VFVSYSHKDEPWKELLRPQLRVLAQLNRIDLWDDRKIDAGDSWYPEIKAAMERAAAAVCLISANYLSSSFVLKEEVPYILAQREERGLLLLPVLISACQWELVDWISAIQMVPRDAKTLDSLPDYEKAAVLSGLAGQIAAKLGKKDVPPGSGLGRATGAPRALRSKSRSVESVVRGEPVEIPIIGTGRAGKTAAFSVPASPVAPPAPEAVDISRLPVTGAELFGRADELRWLDQQWDSREVRVVSLVAWGGVGKSTLVNKWLERMAGDGYRGARKVFGWSFFSQGTSERVTSADLFVDQALRFFGDPTPTEGSPWAKGERLAALVRDARNLLVLDGLEPLQSPADGWRVQDPGLGQLLRRLARPVRGEGGPAGEMGLCVMTSRQKVADLDGFPATTAALDLEQISPGAGRALLRVRGVRGTDAELEQVTSDFGCQALALNLLASFLRGVPGHQATAAAAIPDVQVTDERGRHARRVLEAFARRCGPGPEVELLLLLGLFDRPALPGALAALRAGPAIPGLTDRLAGRSESEWDRLLRKLRTEKLLAEEDKHQPELVDAHPLVREHFGERLEKENPQAWKEGHSRLFDFYSGSAEPQPDSPDGLAPLFAAVYHGCKAGKYETVYESVYWQRIHRGSTFFAVRRLGLFSATLQALGGFFRVRWTQPVLEPSKLLSQAGGFLKAVGQLREAARAREACLAFDQSENNDEGAAVEARNLAILYLDLGEIGKALASAEVGVKLGRRNDDRWQSFAGLGTIMHYAGNSARSAEEFRSAERALLKSGLDESFLYGLAGFQYCDLLLDLGALREVKERAERSLETATWVLDIALDRLSLGRSCLLAAMEDRRLDFSPAREHLGSAVDGFRRAGQQDVLPRGLLARAELQRLTGDFHGAEDDLEESLDICVRCELRLLEADTHLGYTRLHLAAGNSAAARASLARARTLIEQTGYHRRDRDLAELETALAS
jgi:tetratricopeptide (TPR) repeat protein